MPYARLVMMIALIANASFSFNLGMSLILEWPLSRTLEAELPAWFRWGLGAGLVGFAVLVFAIAINPRRWAVLALSVADIGWVLTTTPFAFVPGLFGPESDRLILVTSALVAAFAAGQLFGLRGVLRDPEGPGRYRHCMRISVGAPPEKVWKEIADLGAIARFSDNVARSALRGGGAPGKGAVRDCADTAGRQWSEEVIRFDPEAREVDLRFVTEAENFPYPIDVMVGGWKVRPGMAGAEVDVWWSLTPRGRAGWILVALMTKALDRDLVKVVRRMAGEETGQGAPAEGRAARLAYC